MKSKKSSKKIVSVWLEPENFRSGDPKEKLFYCFNCKTPLVKYSGNVGRIIPGDVPFSPGVTHICRGDVWRNKTDDKLSAFEILVGLKIDVDDASFKRLRNVDKYAEKCGVHYRFYWIDSAVEDYSHV